MSSVEQPQNNTGFENSALRFVKSAERAFTLGGIVGLGAGALSTKYAPVKVQLAQHIQAEAGFISEHGLIAENKENQLAVPHAPVSTPLPGFHGVKVKIRTGDVVHELTHSIKNPKAVENLKVLAAEPKAGIVVPIKKALAVRAGEGAVIGASLFLLPVIGAVALKQFAPNFRPSKIFKKVADAPATFRYAAYMVTAVGVLGSFGFGSKNIVQPSESRGKPLPPWLTSRSNSLKGATMKGPALENVVSEIGKDYDQGLVAGRLTSANLNTEIDRLEAAGENLTPTPDEDTELNQTGILCNIGFTKYVEPTLQKRFLPSVTADLGDRFTTGNTWGYEHNCESNIVSTIANKSSFFGAMGNHEGKPTRWSIGYGNKTTKTINGVTYVSYRDPRSLRWGHKNPPLSDEEVNKLIIEQGSTIAEIACGITKETGTPPDIVANAPEAVVEAELRGCANNVSTGHGVQHNDNKNTTRPIFSTYRSIDGRIVHQLINVTASGSKNHSSPYKKPGKDGAVVLFRYSKPAHQLLKAYSIIFKKNGAVNIEEAKIPEATPVPAYLEQLVDRYSSTAYKVRELRYSVNRK
jgi:hypothetical protein